MDLYKELEIERGATKDEIKKAYRKLAMKYHPDRNSWDSEAEAKFKKINEAYTVLSDDSKRQQYDRFGSTWGAAGFWWAWGWFWWVDVDLWDIFESFFWGWNSRWGSQRRSTERKWEDIEYQMNIDLKTSIFWWKETIKFKKYDSCNICKWEWWEGKKTCRTCSWTGHVTKTTQSLFWVVQQTVACDTCSWTGESFERICNNCNWKKREVITKRIDIDVPAWINNGMIIKMSGEWNCWVWTKASGDLYIKFTIDSEEKWLKRDWVDLFYEFEIDVLEAILWTSKEISIPILWKRNIDIKPWTQSSTTLKISWDWVKDVQTEDKGDLFITINVKIPKKLWKIEKDLYLQIATEKKLNVNNKKWVFENLFW